MMVEENNELFFSAPGRRVWLGLHKEDPDRKQDHDQATGSCGRNPIFPLKLLHAHSKAFNENY